MGSCCSSAAAPVDEQVENDRRINEMLADHSPMGQWNALGLQPPQGAEDLIPQAKLGWQQIALNGLFHHGTGRRPAQVLVQGFAPQYATEYCFPPGHPDQPYGGTGRGGDNGKFTFFLPPTYLADGQTPRASGAVGRLWGQDGFLYEVDVPNATAYTMNGAVANGREIAVQDNIAAGRIRKIAKKHQGQWTIIWNHANGVGHEWQPNMEALYGQ